MSNAIQTSGLQVDQELADFVAAIQQGRRPLVDGREGRKAVAIIEAIYRSAASGRAERL